jgi:hypothetical protein
MDYMVSYKKLAEMVGKSEDEVRAAAKSEKFKLSDFESLFNYVAEAKQLVAAAPEPAPLKSTDPGDVGPDPYLAKVRQAEAAAVVGPDPYLEKVRRQRGEVI